MAPAAVSTGSFDAKGIDAMVQTQRATGLRAARGLRRPLPAFNAGASDRLFHAWRP